MYLLRLFEKTVNEHDGLWPSRIQVDYGVENVSICDGKMCFGVCVSCILL